MNKRLKLSIAVVFIVLVAVILIARILENGVTVVIRNVGDEPLQSVVVHVTGNSYPVGDIEAGVTRAVKVVTTGESDIFIENSNQEKLVVGVYFESGYRGKISIDVTSNEIVDVKNETRIGPY